MTRIDADQGPAHPPELPSYVDVEALDRSIEAWYAEDVGSGDVTTDATIPEDRQAYAEFLVKEEGVIAGLGVVNRVFCRRSPSLAPVWRVEDGAAVAKGQVIGTVTGNARSLLIAERLALNLLQRMSGIATATRRMAERAQPALVLDTRKTAPGLRMLDKWAVLLGGGANHRIGLFDRVLIKDNHIEAVGGIEEAVRSARAYLDRTSRHLEVEVEVRSLDEVRRVLEMDGVDWILLDNMVRRLPDGGLDTTLLRSAVRLVAGRIRTEASGNVTEETVAAIAATGVDAISSGALTHSVRALDISLKIRL